MEEWWQTQYYSFVVSFLFYSKWIVSKASHKWDDPTVAVEHLGRRRPRSSQLLTLHHGLSRGAGEEDGAGLGGGEHWLDVEPLARQSCVAAARAWSLPHGGRDALMPLCWRCSRQLGLLLRAPRLQTLYKSDRDINHRYPACTCTIQFQLRFLLKLCTSQRRLSLSVG